MPGAACSPTAGSPNRGAGWPSPRATCVTATANWSPPPAAPAWSCRRERGGCGGMRAPAGYSGTPLPGKRGIKAGAHVLLVGAPELRGLAELPADVTLRSGLDADRGPYD